MKIHGICAFLCLMIIYLVDVDAECDEYLVVLEEISCPLNNTYIIKPLKIPEIDWDNVTFPCNSTDETSGIKDCVVELDCANTELYCKDLNKPVNKQTHSLITENYATESNIGRTVVLDLPENNITVNEKPQSTVDEEYNKPMLDVNLIFINENDIDNISDTINKKPRNQILNCDYAETICIDEGRPENDGSIKNYTHHNKPIETLNIEINRDESSTVQPIFTGYFPESSSESSKDYNNDFEDFKTMIMPCSTIKDNCNLNNVTQSLKQINVYIKTVYVENNTITKYPNCIRDSISPENELSVKCEDISFAVHNENILQTPPTPPTMLELLTWKCQIKELNYPSSSKEQRSENKKLYFTNCSHETDITNNKIKASANNVSLITAIKKNETEILSGKTDLNHSENKITILVTDNANNCSNNLSLNIDEGKIIDLSINSNKEKILKNKNVELVLSNCINLNSSLVNEIYPDSKVELTIILKNESLNASNLKQFNGTAIDENVRQRVLLRCDHSNFDPSRNATSNITTLQCESIDLDLNNITGIEMTYLSQTLSNKTATNYENETKLQLLTWNCQISELNNTFEQQSQSTLYFENCSNDVNIINSNNKNGDNDVDSAKTKDGFITNKTKIASGELEQNDDNFSHTNPGNMIKILVTEKANCSNNSYLNIDGGKIIDLGSNNNKKEILLNNIVDLKLSNCINDNSYTFHDTRPELKVELTIILKNESLNTLNLKQFNGTPNDGIDKQRILLRCAHPNLDSNNNTISNKTEILCESIDLEFNNITGIEISAKVSEKSNANNTKELKKTNLKEVEKIDVPKNISETNKTKVEKKRKKDNSEHNEKIKSLNFNREKDAVNGAGQSNLALGSPETEKILLIALLTIISAAILLVIALRVWPKKKEYTAAPTREPPDEEETAF